MSDIWIKLDQKRDNTRKLYSQVWDPRRMFLEFVLLLVHFWIWTFFSAFPRLGKYFPLTYPPMCALTCSSPLPLWDGWKWWSLGELCLGSASWFLTMGLGSTRTVTELKWRAERGNYYNIIPNLEGRSIRLPSLLLDSYTSSSFLPFFCRNEKTDDSV